MGRRHVGNIVCFKSHYYTVFSLLVMNIFVLNHGLDNVQEKGTAFFKPRPNVVSVKVLGRVSSEDEKRVPSRETR